MTSDDQLAACVDGKRNGPKTDPWGNNWVPPCGLWSIRESIVCLHVSVAANWTMLFRLLSPPQAKRSSSMAWLSAPATASSTWWTYPPSLEPDWLGSRSFPSFLLLFSLLLNLFVGGFVLSRSLDGQHWEAGVPGVQGLLGEDEEVDRTCLFMWYRRF